MWSSFKETRDKICKELRCSLEFAEGYLDGKMYRRHNMEMSSKFLDGLDEYAKGFRTGYYVQACTAEPEGSDETPAAVHMA